MAKRALLIGSQTAGLSGVESDVEVAADLLKDLGFTANLCVGQDATRQGILDCYEGLIAETTGGDAAVIYYSGHGGLAANPNYQPMTEEGISEPRYYQFIVPTDIDETKEGDFRGITSLELSVLLAKLTDKTKNVTVILDCCHSARMSRDIDLMPKGLPKPWLVGVGAHIEKLIARGILGDGRHVESNPDAVRLVAAGVNESAYEYTNAKGERIGLLTESFLIAMEEAQGLTVSWHSLGTRVRERVLSITPVQRPEVEGPADRLLFDLETVERTGVLPVVRRDDEPVLQGGRILGVNVGDTYTIMPMGVEKSTAENEIARATVTQVAGGFSKIDVKYKPDYTDIPPGANAFPISATLPKLAIRVRGTGEQGKQFRAAINNSERLRVATDDESDRVLAEVVVADGMIDLRDRSGQLSLIEPKTFSDEAVQISVQNLNIFARVQALLNLSSGEGANKLNIPYKIEWGRVVDVKPQPWTDSEDVVSVGDKVYLQVTNQGSDTLYFSVFDVGLAGQITLFSPSGPSGVELEPKKTYVLGQLEGKGLTGIPLGWADAVPEDGPRPESFVVILSDVEQDLRGLQGPGMKALTRKMLSPLEQLVDQIGWQVTRDVKWPPTEDTPDVRYAVERIDFLLEPKPAPARDEGEFLVDERPKQSVLYLAPKSAKKPPSNVAIRLKELIVHRNRALGGAEIRVDTMIVTAPTNGAENHTYEMETQRFPRIKDGSRLPLDNMLIYHGPVAHFLDMAIWVSRDQENSLTLAELIKSEFNSSDFSKAALAIAGLAVAAPQAAAVVAAVGGAATLIQIGTKLLLQATGKSIGLYRTSHLAFEQFGVGRHPKYDLIPAQDFSFCYEIVKVD